jgi:hypothetical protein
MFVFLYFYVLVGLLISEHKDTILLFRARYLKKSVIAMEQSVQDVGMSIISSVALA